MIPCIYSFPFDTYVTLKSCLTIEGTLDTINQNLLFVAKFSFPFAPNPFEEMCVRQVFIHRCGHQTGKVLYCRNAGINPATKSQVMCASKSVASSRPDSVCRRPDCELRRKGGVWICCNCQYGSDGRNKHKSCKGSGCSHEVCRNCSKRTQSS